MWAVLGKSILMYHFAIASKRVTAKREWSENPNSMLR